MKCLEFKRTVSSCISGFLLTTFFWLPTQISADDALATRQMSSAALQYGISTVRLISLSLNQELPPAEGPLSEKQQAFRRILANYKRNKADNEMFAEGMGGLAQFAVDGTTAVLTASGVGVVPALAFKATGQFMVDELRSKLSAEAKQATQQYLADKKDQLLNIAGTSYEQLQNLSPREMKLVLRESTSVISDLEATLPDDANAKAMSVELVIAQIQNTDEAQLDLIDGNSTAIVELNEGFIRFKEKTTLQLNDHENALNNMQDAVNGLNQSVGRLDAKLDKVSRDAGIIGDFVYRKMDPASKLKAINDGHLEESFLCNDGAATCEASEAKDALVSRLESEVQIQKVGAGLQKTARALNDIGSIAGDLGVDLGEFNHVIEFGSAAANAFMSAAGGNYLGAIASVTGLFGKKKKDPEQVRFEIMMKFLKEQFKVVNIKLDAILERQVQIMDSINAVSTQINDVYVALDRRLSNVQFEVMRTSDNVRDLLWRPWDGCKTLHVYLEREIPESAYSAHGDFRSLDQLVTAFRRNNQAVEQCIAAAQTLPSSLLAGRDFNPPITAAKAISSITQHETSTGQTEEAKFYGESQLKTFRDKTHLPTRKLINDYLDNQRIPRDRAGAYLLTQHHSMIGYEERLLQYDGEPVCENDRTKSLSRYRFVCQSLARPEQAIDSMLQTPLVFDTVVRMSDWLLAASRFQDFYFFLNVRTVTAESLANAVLDSASEDTDERGGERIVETALLLTDVALGGMSMLYGELTAHAVLDALIRPVESDPTLEAERLEDALMALNLAKENKALATNIVTALFLKRYAQSPAIDPDRRIRPNPVLLREVMYETIDRAGMLDLTYANQLFDTTLSLDEQSELQIDLRTLVVNPPNTADWQQLEGPVFAPVLSPDMLARGRIVYPNRFVRILRQRERVHERLLDYQVFKDTDQVFPAERTTIALTIAEAEEGEINAGITE